MRTLARALGGLLTATAPLLAQPRMAAPIRLPPIPAGDGVILVQPRSIALGDDDRTFVADESPVSVLVIDRSGALMRRLGRAGDGPGEFRSPVVGAGRHLVVHDVQRRRLMAFGDDGRLLWDRPGLCCRRGRVRVDRAGRIYAAASPIIVGGFQGSDDLVVFSAAGEPIDTLRVPSVAGDPLKQWTLQSSAAALSVPIPFTSRSYFAVTRTGQIVWSSAEGYTLHEGADVTTPHRRVSVPWTPAALGNGPRMAAREASIAEFVRFVDRAELERAFKLSDVPMHMPSVAGIDVDSCDRWWVLRTSGFQGGPTRFDVLSAGGRVLTAVEVPDRVQEPERLWAVGRSRLAVVVQGATEEPVLRLYDIGPLGPCAP